jgi:single-strand DNA-binding protein
MIKLTAIGHLGKDCTTNEVGGKKVINFNVAHTEKWTAAGGEVKEKTIWIECAYWTEKTGIANYLKKGQQVYVEGQPEVRTWESNGKQGVSLALRVGMVQLLGSANAGQQAGANASQGSSSPAPAAAGVIEEQDLPF